MPVPPTAKPLTVKEFDQAKSGVCGGCSASCGYIAYFKGKELVDLYGHPHDPNGIGSFCTKGITYVQQLPQNPLRITKPLLRKGSEFKEVSWEEAKEVLRESLKGKVAFFFDRFLGLEEYLIAKKLTNEVFTDGVYLPFKSSSVRPQKWVEKKAIFVFEAEPTFSEVMLSRWIVDAFERGAYILSVGSRFTTVFQKASERVLTTPDGAVRILEDISQGNYEERVIKLLELLGEEAQVIVGDTLLRSPFRNRVLNAVKRIRERFGSDYTFVGNITSFETKELKEFLERIQEFDTLVLFGNPFVYLKSPEVLAEKRVINFAYFPTITANYSTLVIPRTTFAEREFVNKGVGFLAYSPQILENEFPNPYELLSEVTGISPKVEEFLENFGISLEDLKNAEGGVSIKGKDIKEFSFEPEKELSSDYWLICDNTLTEDLGHWNPWTHALEREQFAFVSKKTKEELGLKEEIEINGVKLKLKVNNNIADRVIFVPNSFEEFQPFEPGVRVGRLMKKPYYRIEEFS